MASAYRISIGVNVDASGAKTGSAAAQHAVSTIGTAAQTVPPKVLAIGDAAEKTHTKLQQLIATSTGLHDGAANQNARAWTGALAAEGLSIDNLRTKYNPLFAVIQRYKESQVEIRTALAMGALSSDEYTAAMTRERQATLATIDAIKGRNTALSQAPRGAQGGGNERFQTANLAFQAQDILTTAPFMPWYTVALQQGPQVAAVMDSLEDKSAGLRAAFMSLISPWSLISVAAVGALAFGVQYFMNLGDEAKDAKATLDGHVELIRRIKSAYGEAAEGLREYANESDKLLRQDIVDRIKAYRDTILDTARSLRSGVLDLPSSTFGGATFTIQQLQSAIAQLDRGIKSGSPDLQAFIGRLIDIENQSGTSEQVKKLIKEIRDSATAGIEAQRGLEPLVGVIEGIGAAAAGQVSRVEALAKALDNLNGFSLPKLSDLEQAVSLRDKALASEAGATEAGVREIENAYRKALERIDAQNPTVTNIDGHQSNVPTPGSKPSTLGDEPGKVSSEVRGAANAYRDLIKSADDRIAQMKLEAEISGETGIAAETLRFKLDLLQDSEDKGRSLSPKQVEAINARVEAFKRYAEEAAKAKLKSDLLFDRDQLGRSGFDQQIAGQLRGAGLAVDFDSYEAGLIRTNLQMEYARDLAGDFTSTFLGGLEQGKNAWAAFGDVGMSALKKISDTLVNDLLNSIFQVQGAAGGSGGDFFGNLFSGLFGGGGSKAPSFLNNGFDTSPMKGFDGGGYTGPGGRFEPRGLVHAGEIVFNQDDVSRHGGVAAVEALRLGLPGYSGGGVVGVEPLMSRQQSHAQSAGNASIGTLLIKLGLAADAEMNIMPMIKDVVAQDAPGFAMQVVDDYRDRGLADDVLGVMDNPRVRGNG